VEAWYNIDINNREFIMMDFNKNEIKKLRTKTLISWIRRGWINNTTNIVIDELINRGVKPENVFLYR
jgi:hypothetical protein